MKKEISIIDSGLSNIYNVCQAFQYIGMSPNIIKSSNDKIGDYLVLPGVGTFKNGMTELHDRGLIEKIIQHVTLNKPFLGICLGMQMMLEKSTEFGNFSGIGIIKGAVNRIPSCNTRNIKHKIPHIGWNQNKILNKTNKILKNIPNMTPMYFVHSYMAQVKNEENLIATCDYNGIPITSIISENNSYGCQFHPEKSGDEGLMILRNFAEL
jgi:glutamine amidotransferase